MPSLRPPHRRCRSLANGSRKRSPTPCLRLSDRPRRRVVDVGQSPRVPMAESSPKARIRYGLTGGPVQPRPTAFSVASVERSEEHTYELQSLMSISYTFFSLKT